MRGLKRKIKIENIENKTVKSVAFTKRRDGLFRKASKLCLLSPATQIAIITTPPSSNSHASFYTFGHSSVDNIVFSLLHGQSPLPTNQSGLGFWWEDERFDRSENIDELKEATDAISRMLNNVRLRLDDVKSNQRDVGLVIHQEEAPQLPYTETNKNNEERMNQIPKFDGATSGSESLQENEDILDIDDFLISDVMFDPLFLF